MRCAHGGVGRQAVLVAGGAGAVGHYAVQMARLARRAPVDRDGQQRRKRRRSRAAAGADETIELPTRTSPRGCATSPPRRRSRDRGRLRRQRAARLDAVGGRRSHGLRQRLSRTRGAVLPAILKNAARALHHRLRAHTQGPGPPRSTVLGSCGCATGNGRGTRSPSGCRSRSVALGARARRERRVTGQRRPNNLLSRAPVDPGGTMRSSRCRTLEAEGSGNVQRVTSGDDTLG